MQKKFYVEPCVPMERVLDIAFQGFWKEKKRFQAHLEDFSNSSRVKNLKIYYEQCRTSTYTMWMT
jgi:hypothetical protein